MGITWPECTSCVVNVHFSVHLFLVVMAKISIRINISLEISIFLPSAVTPFSLPLTGCAHSRKENTPIHGPKSTLIAFKIRRSLRTLLAPPPHHRPILFTVLVLNATEVKIGGSAGKLTRQRWRWQPKIKKIWLRRRDFLLREKILIQKN